MKVIVKDTSDEWKAKPNPYATAYSNARGCSIRRKERGTSIPPTIQELALMTVYT
jgi:hypothetical protein